MSARSDGSPWKYLMSKKLIKELNSEELKNRILAILPECLSASKLLKELGYTTSGRNIKTIREWLIYNNISISHWTNNGVPPAEILSKTCPVCSKIFTGKIYDIKDQITCSIGCANTFFRTNRDNPNYISGRGSYRKYALTKLGSKCIECGYSNVDALEVHHIDKDRTNNNLSNLEVLCANCHKLTHKGLLKSL